MILLSESGLELVYTKQKIFKIGSSFFDPLGLACSAILQAKLLFQEF